MSSEASHVPQGPSFFEQLMSNSRNNTHLPLFLPFILGFTNTEINSNPVQDSSNQPQQNQEAGPERVILINPLTQSMVVIQSSSASNLESFFRGVFAGKDGQPPASKSSIEAMESVEISEENCEGECVICLEEWELGHVAKEMPCKHKFHGDCIEKWLKIHGSCPVCRFNMPVEEAQDFNKNSESGDRGRGGDIWVSFPVDSGRSSPNSDESDHS